MIATINTLPRCPWCIRAKRLLSLKNINYTEIQGKADNWPTVPYITINGEHIGGFTELAAWSRKN